jgi:hypothetical protein
MHYDFVAIPDADAPKAVERRFFAQFVGTEEQPVEELLPSGEKPVRRRTADSSN